MTEATYAVTYASVGRFQGVGPDPRDLLAKAGFDGDWRAANHRITVRHPQSVVADGEEVGPVADLELIKIEVFA